MIQSMTGYGKINKILANKKITVEIKSLNSKNLDINTRIPSVYREKDIEIRKMLAKNLMRGKIEFSIYVENTGENASAVINKNIVSGYMEQLKDLNTGSDDLLAIAMRLPDVLKAEREELNEEEWNQVYAMILEAIEKLQEYRKDEGEVLKADFILHLNNIQHMLDEILKIDKERLDAVREKLLKAISEIEVNYDENRYEQELLYYIEKLDITEEKVRLGNHLDYFKMELESEVSNGKKLAFISQEMGREINTIGSKANYAPMQKLVVQMKDDLEKIKEQLLNIL
ncbi:MAG: YicC family protein [Flavobacteriia bacterium]|nr:MAG: YicC family protein [Flavobacteriia bacterium]